MSKSEHFEIHEGSQRRQLPALLVNIFGGPGLGKSTLAAHLFHALKIKGIEVASPEEYAKIAIWQGRSHLLDQQVVIAGHTWDTLVTLSSAVDVIIVDSPILLGAVYGRDREPACFSQLMLDLHRRHDRLNILLERNPFLSYDLNGRRESLDEARAVDELVKGCLNESGDAYTQSARPADNVEILVETIEHHVLETRRS